MKKKIIAIVSIILLVVVLSFFAVRTFTAHAVKEQESYKTWLTENCNCTERERPKCTLEGFEYDEEIGFCVNKKENTATNPTLGCSKYDCDGEIHEFNFKTGKWQKAN